MDGPDRTAAIDHALEIARLRTLTSRRCQRYELYRFFEHHPLLLIK